MNRAWKLFIAVVLLTIAIVFANVLTRSPNNGGAVEPRFAAASSSGPVYATPVVLAAQSVGTLTAGATAWVVTPPSTWTYVSTCPSTCDGAIVCVTAGGLDGGSGCWVQVVQQQSTFTYQPGGTENQQLGIYPTWAGVYAAASAATALAPTVVIDTHLSNTAVIPSGTWIMPGWTIKGRSGNGTAASIPDQIAVQDGAHLILSDSGAGTGVGNLTLTNVVVQWSSTTISPIAVTSGLFFLYLNYSTIQFSGSPTVPFITNTGATFEIYVLGLSALNGGGSSAPVIQANAGGGTVYAFLYQGGFMNSHVFAGTGAINLFYDSSCTVPTQTLSPSAYTLNPALGTQSSQAAPFFSLALTLTSGTKTLASGKNLTQATLLGCKLTTATTAVGVPNCTFVAGANGNVTCTSIGPAATTLTTDASTYTCTFAGAY